MYQTEGIGNKGEAWQDNFIYIAHFFKSKLNVLYIGSLKTLQTLHV